MHASEEPRIDVRLGNSELTLLGTAHVSRASADKVRGLLQGGDYDAVAVELCPSRHQALMDPDALARMDLFSVIRQGRVYMVVASLALAAYQQRLADQFGIEPGAEQRAAILVARERRLPVLLVDREIGVTLKRTAGNLSWWKRFGLFSGLLATLLSREEVTEEEIERLKEGDVLETTFAEFAEDRRDLYVPLIDERDRYMAARLREEIASKRHEKVLAVLGAGHIEGVAGHLREVPGRDPRAELAELDRLPSPQRWPKLIPWLVVVLVLGGFGYGFYQSPGLGLRVVLDWVLINGSLSALGAAVAAGHPLTVVTAFLAAPLTSLNPTIGAGMVTGAAELYLRRPSIGDFGRLRRDTATLKGWWRNRVSRTLLVFLFSTLGSAIGTYVAGFRIFERLFA
ncbi:TraB/GumN family protein [Candidatus Thiosymbion oneisti]|uniref:TraB/GumN family protein n=1 Tax=Candidatus Thiosymbion oneisti TaxID=589554 RepID=UPI000A4EDCDC|nr:TraB/GumN family protein [Candidatus Thiosymbion oneisti]